jgi:small subunit ribosomal protein S21
MSSLSAEPYQPRFLQYAGRNLVLSAAVCSPRWKGGVVLPKVVLRPGESQGSLLKRFRKKVARSKVLSTVRRKRWYISTSEQRRMEKQKAIRKAQRRLSGWKPKPRPTTAGPTQS